MPDDPNKPQEVELLLSTRFRRPSLPLPGLAASFVSLVLLSGSPLAAVERPLGLFDGHSDVGSPKNPGSATYNAASQEYRLSASGVNMWAERDEFQFVWRRMKGDFLLQARVELLGQGVDPHRKLGWIVRTSLDADSPYADAAVHGDGLTSLQYRRSKGAATEEVRSAITGADVVQLERRGKTYVMSVARFGDTFTVSQLSDLDLGDEVYVGLFLCAHNPEVVERAVFRDVRIVRPAKADFVPYRDYIGSHLELLDVATGHRQVLRSSDQPFEAPNWTPDGGALFYNSSGSTDARGRIYRFDLATRQATLVDTATNVRCNNDHVLSFDGSMLGISDQSAEGKSIIYTLPSAGGTPKRITPLGPSYLPEYSPDGEYVYFNSTRSGTMQIWRMKPDGSSPEQVTNDEFNNWFPHISPDGQWIAYIAFPKEVSPSDHPYYKHVYLRLMPAAGGPAKVIAYVYGGQGTINVPSWSPDGTMLAFVSNSAMD